MNDTSFAHCFSLQLLYIKIANSTPLGGVLSTNVGRSIRIDTYEVNKGFFVFRCTCGTASEVFSKGNS